MRTQTYLLPEHWAPYLINGDETGYSPEELSAITSWEIANAPGPCLGCEDFSHFEWCGDDGRIGEMRCTYTFQVIQEIILDGEVIGYY